MEQALKVWHVLEILKVTESAFAGKGIKNPRLNAELLLADVLKCRRIELYLDFEKPLTAAELAAFREHVKRRLKHEPIQYILGKTEFYGLSFNVSPAVLIPRQETELLVEEVLKHLKVTGGKRVLDIGTGSGCLAIAVAANCDCKIDAIDISTDALQIAKENSNLNNTTDKITFLQKDILTEEADTGSYDVVMSNPPYIPAEEMKTVDDEVKLYEPQAALTDNADGLVFYRWLIELCQKAERKPVLFAELGDGKAGKIEELLKERGVTNYRIAEDLIKIPRVLIAEFN
ncbi:MAG: peptide chain release factor N(5)-glutamine methyltransferase [Ignavibacteria bacterium]|nr:peptide chain release factor N(5)-glutamine methyltransferase [Ignavibacteria bacterium]